MKTTIETLEFPCEIKKKLKMKVSMGNLEVEFIDGHLIKFDKTNLSVQEPYKIIVNNKHHTLVALLYNDEDKIYEQVIDEMLDEEILDKEDIDYIQNSYYSKNSDEYER